MIGKMAGEKRFVDRDVLDPDSRRVQRHVDDTIQHQERVAVRYVVHDSMDIDQLDRPTRACMLFHRIIH